MVENIAKDVRFSSTAIAEMVDTAQGFESRHSGLGQQFLDGVDLLIPALRGRPSSYPRLHDVAPELDIRWAVLAHFPVSLLFLELEDEIHILGVAHSRRRAEDQMGRLPIRF